MLQTVVSTACTTAALVISFPPSCRADEGYQNKNTAPSAVTTPLAAEAEADAVVTPTITKPYAPVETLIPATRVKRLIDRSVALATELVEEESGEADIDRQRQRRPPAVIVEELQSLLLFEPQNFTACINTPSFVPAVPRQPAKQYLDAYDRNRETLNVIAKPGAMLVQNGEIAAWKQLKQQEVLKEQQDDIRAALNLYTSSLTFSGTAYVLTVPKPVRSKMVREDRLPDVTQVIQSDMGMRYLHRNEILTAMEDARAELRYQLSLQQQQQQQPQQKEAFLDGADLLEILKRAQRAATQWFALIDEGDVQAAVAAVELQECSTSPVALPSS